MSGIKPDFPVLPRDRVAAAEAADRLVRDGELRLVRHIIAEAMSAAKGDRPGLLEALEIERRILTGATARLEQHMALLGWVP